MLFGCALHLPFCMLFVNYCELDIVGLGVASSVKDLIVLSIIMVYGNFSTKISKCLRTPDRESFSGWGEYLSISFPATGMICAELWGYQVLTIIAGTLGAVEQGSQALITTIGLILFMFPTGVQEAACAIIGNCVGSNNIPLAKRFFRLMCYINIAMTLTLSTFCLFGRHAIIKFFTEDEAMAAISGPVLMLMSFNFLFNGMQGFF